MSRLHGGGVPWPVLPDAVLTVIQIVLSLSSRDSLKEGTGSSGAIFCRTSNHKYSFFGKLFLVLLVFMTVKTR